MNTLLSNQYLLFVARAVLGLVFIVASIEKIAVPEMFAIAIEGYKMVPHALTNLFALVLPWIELLCGVFLIAGVFTRASATLTSAMLVVFIVAIVTAMARGLDIDCGCFGPANKTPVGWGKVFEDFGLLLLGIYVFIFGERSESARQTTVTTVSPAELVGQ